jgi:hypothetical protein
MNTSHFFACALLTMACVYEGDPRRQTAGDVAGSGDAAENDGGAPSATVSTSSSGGNGEPPYDAGSGGSGDTTMPDAVAPDAGEQPSSICHTPSGTEIPYDHSRGLCTEYVFELSMHCDVGGFLLPLIEADPVNLTAVDEFVAQMTEWLRAEVLGCKSASDTPVEGGLVPMSQADSMSSGDFDALEALFMSVVDRHDGLEDGFEGKQKAELERRLFATKSKFVKQDSPAFSKRLALPECADPTTGGAGGAGGAAGAAGFATTPD